MQFSYSQKLDKQSSYCLVYPVWSFIQNSCASLFRSWNPSLIAKLLALLNGTLDPRMHVMVDFRISVDMRALSHVIVSEYSWFIFSDKVMASYFKNIWHSFPIPPFVPNIRGVKAPCSTFSTRSRYSRFFSCSCALKIASVDLLAWLRELTCVTLMSKNAVRLLCQKP